MKLLERLIAALWMINVALIRDLLHQSPREAGLIEIAAPILLEAAMRHSQVVRRNSSREMVRHMDVDVMAEKLNPGGIFTVNRTR